MKRKSSESNRGNNVHVWWSQRSQPAAIAKSSTAVFLFFSFFSSFLFCGTQTRARRASMKFGYTVSAARGARRPWLRTHSSGSPLQFSNLCGTVYKQGNLVFTPDGNSLLSPVGNRVSVFDLVS